MKISNKHIGLWGMLNMETGYMCLFNGVSKQKEGYGGKIFWVLLQIRETDCVFASQPYGEQIIVDKKYIKLLK